MKFLILTNVLHFKSEGKYFAYSPFVNEMNLWNSQSSKVYLIAPFSSSKNFDFNICTSYSHSNLKFIKIPSFNLKSPVGVLKSIFSVPYVCILILFFMFISTHIHLRCPCNIGLISCFLQVFFPFKYKTAKYAGNWDPDSVQPWSFKLQKFILNNPILTKNIKVLVYGSWANASRNIVPFFTASYSSSESYIFSHKQISISDEIRFIFVGSLNSGKNPFLAISLIEILIKRNIKVKLDFYGSGPLFSDLFNIVNERKLSSFIHFHGNLNREKLKNCYLNSHFLLLFSSSEGWPKVVAEAMWWGCVPVVLPVSCVPFMLDFGNRGVLADSDMFVTSDYLIDLISNDSKFNLMRFNASQWAHEYTIELFEDKIKCFLKS